MTLDIVCAIDNSLYYQMLCKGLIKSLLKNSCQNKFNIHVLKDCKNHYPLDDLKNKISFHKVKPLNIICGCVKSKTTFAKLEIPNIKQFKNLERILYLDVDTFCLSDITSLEKFKFEKIAMVNPGGSLYLKEFLQRVFHKKIKPLTYFYRGKKHLIADKDQKYSNAGVMLINPKIWYMKRISDQIKRIILTHCQYMYTSDEMAINLFFKGMVDQLPEEYNTMSFSKVKNPKIIHFNTKKPILGSSLYFFHNWLSLFDKNDKKVLLKLEAMRGKSDKSRIIKIKSDAYHEFLKS